MRLPVYSRFTACFQILTPRIFLPPHRLSSQPVIITIVTESEDTLLCSVCHLQSHGLIQESGFVPDTSQKWSLFLSHTHFLLSLGPQDAVSLETSTSSADKATLSFIWRCASSPIATLLQFFCFWSLGVMVFIWGIIWLFSIQIPHFVYQLVSDA